MEKRGHQEEANIGKVSDTEEQRKLLCKLRRKFAVTAREVLLLERLIFESPENLLIEDTKEEEMGSDEIKIPVFDGKDYSTWKKRIFTFLKMKKCINVCKREKTATDKADTWDEQDLKAVNYIYGALSNKQMEFVNDEETCYAVAVA